MGDFNSAVELPGLSPTLSLSRTHNQTPRPLPKLSLNTTCSQQRLWGTGNTGLRLESTSNASPTTSNTHSNAFLTQSSSYKTREFYRPGRTVSHAPKRSSHLTSISRFTEAGSALRTSSDETPDPRVLSPEACRPEDMSLPTTSAEPNREGKSKRKAGEQNESCAGAFLLRSMKRVRFESPVSKEMPVFTEGSQSPGAGKKLCKDGSDSLREISKYRLVDAADGFNLSESASRHAQTPDIGRTQHFREWKWTLST